tara:strand:- start:47436 stop:47600 length:165 start_codon:yes stop_codon:yes gene_type:complete
MKPAREIAIISRAHARRLRENKIAEQQKTMQRGFVLTMIFTMAVITAIIYNSNF